MNRTKWTDRIFSFDIPEGWIFNILERLSGTSIRINELVKDLSSEQLLWKDQSWSIQQHVGHLLDLEELHYGRIIDYMEKKNTVRPADMSNQKTEKAEHHKKSISELTAQFNEERNKLVEAFLNLDDETMQFRSMHPRLKVMMRPVDMAYFTAEHDDHHLASIRMMCNQLKNIRSAPNF